MRFPGCLLSYRYILSYVSKYWCHLPRYMVSASRKNWECCPVLSDFKFNIVSTHFGPHSRLTRLILDTWRWIRIVRWLEWVIIPFSIIRPNIYSKLGSRSVMEILRISRTINGTLWMCQMLYASNLKCLQRGHTYLFSYCYSVPKNVDIRLPMTISFQNPSHPKQA